MKRARIAAGTGDEIEVGGRWISLRSAADRTGA
jgi:hypothetical protein